MHNIVWGQRVRRAGSPYLTYSPRTDSRCDDVSHAQVDQCPTFQSHTTHMQGIIIAHATTHSTADSAKVSIHSYSKDRWPWA